MINLKRDISQISNMINEYQKHVILGRQFIRELEAEGGETNYLKNEIAKMELKIKELQMKNRYSF